MADEELGTVQLTLTGLRVHVGGGLRGRHDLFTFAEVKIPSISTDQDSKVIKSEPEPLYFEAPAAPIRTSEVSGDGEDDASKHDEGKKTAEQEESELETGPKVVKVKPGTGSVALLASMPDVIVDAETLRRLVNLSFEVAVYVSSASDSAEGGEPVEPKLVATGKVPLSLVFGTADCLYEGKVSLEKVYEEEEEETEGVTYEEVGSSLASVVLSCTTELADFAAGGSVVRIAGVALLRAPKEWAPKTLLASVQELGDEASVEDVKALINERVAAENKCMEHFVSIEPAGDLVFPKFVLPAGTLKYEIPAKDDQKEDSVENSNEGDDDEEAQGSEAEDENKPTKSELLLNSLTWSVDFRADELNSFLTRKELRKFQALLRAKDPTTLSVTLYHGKAPPSEEEPSQDDKKAAAKKAKGKGKGKGEADATEEAPVEPAWVCAGTLDLSGYSEKDCKSLHVEGKVKDVTPNVATWADAVNAVPERSASNSRADKGKEILANMSVSDKAAMWKQRSAGLSESSLAASIVLSKAPVQRVKSFANNQAERKISDIVTPKKIERTVKNRDAVAELRKEFRKMLLEIAEEYTVMFGEPIGPETNEDDPHVNLQDTEEERRKQLIFSLNANGIYHGLKERLKPRIQRFVKAKFSHAPKDDEELSDFLTELYSSLQDELAHAVAEETEAANERPEDGGTRQGHHHSKRRNIPEEIHERTDLAEDDEISGHPEWAERRLLDVVALATELVKLEGHYPLLSAAWKRLGSFYSRASGESYPVVGTPDECVSKAFSAFEESAGLLQGDVKSIRMLTAILFERGDLDDAKVCMEGALEVEAPAPNEYLEEGDDSGYNSDTIAEHTSCHTLILGCILEDAHGRATKARRYLNMALESRRIQKLDSLNPDACKIIVEADENITYPRTAPSPLPEGVKGPRRDAVTAFQDIAEWALRFHWLRLARRALELADLSEKTAQLKAQQRSLSRMTPTFLRLRGRVLAARMLLAEKRYAAAKDMAQEALDMCDGPNDASALLAYADACLALQDRKEACQAYLELVNLLEVRQRNRRVVLVPRRVYLSLGRLHAHLGKYSEAKKVFLRAADAWNAKSAWLGAAVACLRLDHLREAQECLQEASALDERDPLVWGYITLMSLMKGEEFLADAKAALAQGIKLGLNDADLLRELAGCLVAIDEYVIAEDLLRRACVVVEKNPKAGSLTHTRRFLADVLSAQNNATSALSTYIAIVRDVEAPNEERNQAMGSATDLLRSLGREDEIPALEKLRRKVVKKLST